VKEGGGDGHPGGVNNRRWVRGGTRALQLPGQDLTDQGRGGGCFEKKKGKRRAWKNGEAWDGDERILWTGG